MQNYPYMATAIKMDPLYDLVHKTIKDHCGCQEPTEAQIIETLKNNEEILKSYLEINIDNGASNINLKQLPISADDSPEKQQHLQSLNQSIEQLRKNERFQTDVNGSTPVVVLSFIGVLAAFILHNVAIYLDLYQKIGNAFYSSYGVLLVATFLIYKRIKSQFVIRKAQFEAELITCQKLFEDGIQKGFFTKEELYQDYAEENPAPFQGLKLQS